MMSHDVYRLHIDATPIRKIPAIKHRTVNHKTANKIWVFVWDKMQFVLVSLGVFIVLYVVLNWQALLLNARYYLDQWRGVKSPFERLVDNVSVGPEKLISVDAGKKFAAIPPLNLEIYPPDMRIVIPRINQNVPVVGVKNENLISRKWEELESDIQKALKSGVIHYPGTALPGDNGNVVITGHSSYYAWDAGRFKDVFSLLHEVKIGDKVVVYFNQKKFVYQVFDIKVVKPENIDVLAPTSFEQLTLITCTPIGTNLKRLIVTAKLVEKT